MNVLLTGFGPFPGAPFNPTGPLVRALARRAQPGARRSAHVFRTSYATVDRELPQLIAASATGCADHVRGRDLHPPPAHRDGGA